MIKAQFTILFLFVSFVIINAQQTGKYTELVDFSSSNDYPYQRDLAWFVPEDYDSNKSYTLIVGFRGGPHSQVTNFRDQLLILSDSMNAIIVCPDNKPHFNIQENEAKLLYNHTVDRAISNYNIDQSKIYLTGLSYGGRHTVITSLTNPEAKHDIRGIITFATGTNTENIPAYNNTKTFPPSCICSGTNDSQHFKTISTKLNDKINQNGGKSTLVSIPNVGHTTAFPSFKEVFLDCITFIEEQYKTGTTNIYKHNSNSIIVYPNPSKEFLNITIKTADLKINKINILTMNGQIIKSISGNVRIIDLAEFQDHQIYLLQFVTNKGNIVKKI